MTVDWCGGSSYVLLMCGWQIESRLPRSEKLRLMVYQGVPHSIRSQIWMRTTGALEKKTKSEMSYKVIVKTSSNDHLMTSKQIEKVSITYLFVHICCLYLQLHLHICQPVSEVLYGCCLFVLHLKKGHTFDFFLYFIVYLFMPQISGQPDLLSEASGLLQHFASDGTDAKN